MAQRICRYLIGGGGLAGAWAVQGIREYDANGPITLVGEEKHLPYDRPPLTKQLWFGKKKLEDIFVQAGEFYKKNGVDLVLGRRIIKVDVGSKTAVADDGCAYKYEKLLLATGGIPKRLAISGGNLEGVCYYRYLEDYVKTRDQLSGGAKAVVVGGGFIGSELAAALTVNGVKVTMVFPSPYLVDRVFPKGLGLALQHYYVDHRGVEIFSEDKPSRFCRKGARFLIETEKGNTIESDILIVGVGISPSVELARGAGLDVDNGIVVNEYLQTSHPDVYAAGDNALFHYKALGQMMRVEHWDNAVNQGKCAGWNMAGAHMEYTYMPYFFSDLFEFGYEAVGDVDSRLQTFEDWQEPARKGVIYYLKDGRVRGAMMCNIWEKVEEAREMIMKGLTVPPDKLRGAIRDHA